MKKGQGIFLGFTLLAALGVTIVSLIFAFEFMGMLLKSGIEAMARVFHSQAEIMSVTNYVFEWYATLDIMHIVFEAIILTVIAIWMFAGDTWEKLIGRKKTVWYFITFFLIATIALEVVSYLAYVLQFVLDAIVAGITSREVQVTLLNIISFQRFGEIDFFGRLCEGWVFTRIFFVIRVFIIRRRWRQNRIWEQERAEAAAREEERRRKVKKHPKERELYNVSREYEEGETRKKKPVLYLEGSK